ncbi:substrate-binding periplasmic protein [Pseudomonas sp. 5P_3.1_Bac2]|uniref:substrate-binding periplasmic protein n=1 Tax=Pseudomonas sp. 5P_3.1_Bac2 TaxID=2971617 RepID=UPI0021C91B51|nr:transporter substrate-binding domain-containing protein [Pseudomonas sp. 5P_3.1_Bac2]MCU1717413.1 transporter substrate-binding domain-containing protein [Pseudomonas sp. 5P_3.1_Bac2]
MRRHLLVLVVLLHALSLLGLPAQAQVRDYDTIIQSGVLKVALYKDFPPYSFTQDGQPRGTDYDIAQALAKALAVKLEVIWAPPGEKLDDDLRDYIWKGHYLRPKQLADVMLRVPYDREFSYKRNELGELINERVVMFGPYQRERWQVAYDKRRLKAVPSVAVFRSHPIGVEVESVPSFYLSSVFEGSLSQQTHHYSTPELAFAAMQAAQVDAVMALRGEVQWLYGQAHDQHLALAENAYPNMGRQVWDIGMAVHESNRQLAYALEEQLEQLILSGELKKIFARYGLNYELPELYQESQ